MKKLISLFLLSFVFTACSANVDQAKEIQGVEFDTDTVTINYTDNSQEDIFQYQPSPESSWLAEIVDATLSESKRFIAIEQSYPEGISVTIHDLQTSQNHDGISHRGSLTWDGDKLIIESKKESPQGDLIPYRKISTSEQTPWELQEEQTENTDTNSQEQQDEDTPIQIDTPEPSSVTFDDNSLQISYTDDSQKEIDYTTGLNLTVSLGKIIDATLSPSGKFIAIETSQGGGTGVIIHDLQTGENHVVQSHTGSIKWDGDKLVIDNEGGFENFSVYQSTSVNTPWEVELISPQASSAAIYDSCGKVDEDKYKKIKQQLTNEGFIYPEHRRWLHSGKYVEELCYSEAGANLIVLLRHAKGLGDVDVSVINYDLTNNTFTSSNTYNILYGTVEFGKRTKNIIPIKVTGTYPDFSDPDNPTSTIINSETIYYNLDTEAITSKK